jgi:hypothetical protein
MGGDSAMAKLTEPMEAELIEEEDELDGWGPVRVRRSSVPAQPYAPITAKGVEIESDADMETLQASDADLSGKRLVT